MRITSALVILATFAAVAGAQTPATSEGPRAFVHIIATDSSGAPVAGAEVTIRTGLTDVVAQGRTNDEGNEVLSVVVRDSANFQLTMRKVGYPRGDRFFAIGPFDTTKVHIVVPTLSTGAVQLAEVDVRAKRVSPTTSYTLSADEIENAKGFLPNGWEVLKQLRPAMLASRGGCPSGAQNIWVNGQRIRLPLPVSGMAAARANVGLPPRTRVSYAVVSVLADIQPEHIAEIHYKDCLDHSAAMVGATDAIYVTLKPGVIYQRNVGSVVLAETEHPPMEPEEKK
jgi:hypothetical protein